jgi:phenylacetate-CoA ligase
LLAREQLDGRLHIQPSLVSSSGESLSAAMRERIQAAWGVHVWDGYSSSETGVMAAECAYGRLHLNADWFIIEAVDADNQPVPAGQPAHKILVTNLASKIQPIIRYEMSDSVTFYPDACPCGSPLPSLRVEGRTDEILAIPDAQGQIVYLLPLSLGSAVEEVAGVHRFQIVQTTPTTLHVRLDVVDEYEKMAVWTAVSAQLRQLLDKNNLLNVTLALAQETPQRNEHGGKLNHILSLVEPVN